LLTAINPRRSSPLATIKQEIKELFEEHGDEIDSPYDALERLPQEQLSEYGVEAGSVEETYIFQTIKERMHRHLRAGVERVFSRLKSFTGLDRVRARKENDVETHVVLSAVAPVAASLTAKRQDKLGLIRSPSRLICWVRTTARMSPPERHRSQAARICGGLLIDTGRLPAYSAKPISSCPKSESGSSLLGPNQLQLCRLVN
jgi:hypothetical protein